VAPFFYFYLAPCSLTGEMSSRMPIAPQPLHLMPYRLPKHISHAHAAQRLSLQAHWRAKARRVCSSRRNAVASCLTRVRNAIAHAHLAATLSRHAACVRKLVAHAHRTATLSHHAHSQVQRHLVPFPPSTISLQRTRFACRDRAHFRE
jgi:hypothetical protein